MNSDEKNIALLPSGFTDLLPPEAGREADAITALLGVFAQFGYHRVKPPMVEFEESLIAPGPGAKLAQKMFRLMDPISHRMMGVRSDITAQIARIAGLRLRDEPRPLRLTYANDVLRTQGSQQRTERQFVQVGCEIIGVDDVQADVEACVVALAGLAKLGLGKVTLDICLPQVVQSVVTHYALDEEAAQAARQALADRDLSGLQALEGEISDKLVALLQAAGPVEGNLDTLLRIRLPEEAAQMILTLKEFYEELSGALDSLGLNDVTVSVDPVETHGFEYHKGLGFALFSEKVRGPLGRGGRYDIVFGEDDATESACGFTLYMDTVRTAMPKVNPKDVVFVPAAESWGVIKALQDEGWIVTRGTGQNKAPDECTHEYKDGQVVKLG